MTPLLLAIALTGATTAAVEPLATPQPTPASSSAAGRLGPQWSVLVGTWTGEGEGQPGSGVGISSFAYELDSRVLVRRSRSDYPASAGRPAVHHEDLMLIYPGQADGPARAIYFDNEGHVIEYQASWSPDGESVTLISPVRADAPTFRLTYRVLAPGRLSVSFEIAPPGSSTFNPYLTGVLRRS